VRRPTSTFIFYARPAVLALPIPALILVVWHALVTRGIWPRSIIPTPLEALDALSRLTFHGPMFHHVAISLTRLAVGFGSGCVLGMLLASAVTLSSTARLLLGPALSLLAPVPVIAWIPLLIVSLGLDGSKVALIAVGTMFIVYAFALTGFAETRSEYMEVARHYGKSRLTTFFQVVLPSSAHTVLGGMRVAMGLSWVLLIASELIASSAGLGWFIWDSRNFSRPDEMVAGMMVVALLGLGVDVMVHAVQRWLARWREPFDGR
jgi:sulfonate transport system permease protein